MRRKGGDVLAHPRRTERITYTATRRSRRGGHDGAVTTGRSRGRRSRRHLFPFNKKQIISHFTFPCLFKFLFHIFYLYFYFTFSISHFHISIFTIHKLFYISISHFYFTFLFSQFTNYFTFLFSQFTNYFHNSQTNKSYKK
jgi:hypothetical protein